MSEWDNIHGFDGWRAKLADLLKEAEAAAHNTDLASRLALANRLTEFILHSSPNTAEIIQLDAIAESARAGLMRMTIDERLAAISARTGELARLTKEFQARTAAAEASAASIRLERAHRVVGSLTDSVRALTEFRGMLETGKDDDLAKSIERIIASIQRLRSDVEATS